MIYIGIDQSIKFTGITIYRPGAPTEHIFYGITHLKHTKWDKFTNKDKYYMLSICDYKYEEHVDDYVEDERIKYKNIKSLITEIDHIFRKVDLSFPEETVEVRMEGISFGSRQTTAIAELSALNFMIRELCEKYHFSFTILPPTKVKKFATGNGQADKELMMESFFVLNPQFRDISKLIKFDDIADSFFMATYQE